jgi:predicted nuclease of predicted toxin-antitoxin system
MEWLADENIPGRAITFLRSLGEDVLAVGEVAPGGPDREVISLARLQGRILLSFDRDHGDLIFNQSVAAPPAVIYLRLYPADPAALERVLAGLIDLGGAALAGMFTVVTADGIRQRRLPGANG